MTSFSTNNREIFFILKNCEGSNLSEKKNNLLNAIIQNFDLDYFAVKDALNSKLRQCYINNFTAKLKKLGKTHQNFEEFESTYDSWLNGKFNLIKMFLKH